MTAAIGHNNPPADAMVIANVAELLAEAMQWLDGQPVASQDQADGLALMLNRARGLHSEAETMRKAEAKPWDDGKAKVQAKWNPVLANAEKIKRAADAALAAWSLAQKRRIEAEAQAKAAAAAKAAEEARAAHQAADATNLAACEAAEAKMEEAKRLQREADLAAKEKAQARPVDGSRAIGVSVKTVAVAVTDAKAAKAWVWERHPQELIEAQNAALLEIVKRHKANGVPGIQYREEATSR